MPHFLFCSMATKRKEIMQSIIKAIAFLIFIALSVYFAEGQAKDTRTLEQRGALLALLRELKKKFPEALIIGHHDLNPIKECPCYPCVEEYREL